MNRNLWAMIVFACALLTAAPAAWAAPRSAAPSPDVLNERLETLRDTVKELSAETKANTQATAEHKNGLQAQDKRIEDTNDRFSDLHESITRVLTLISTGAATLGAVVGGFGYFFYKKVRADALQKTELVIMKWLSDNQNALYEEKEKILKELKIAEEKAIQDINSACKQVQTNADNANDIINKRISDSTFIEPDTGNGDKYNDKNLMELMNKPESKRTADDLIKLGLAALFDNKNDNAIYYFGRILELPTATKKQIANALFNRGIALGRQNRPDESIAAYNAIIHRFRDDANLNKQIANALINKGVMLGRQGKTKEGIGAYDEVICRFGKNPPPDLREPVALALINKGVALGRQNELDEAIHAYNEVIHNFDENPTPDLREQAAKALVNKGLVLRQENKLDEAIEAYNGVILRFKYGSTPALREQSARAMVNKGIALGRRGNVDEEMTAYNEVIQNFDDAPTPILCEQLAIALVNKSDVLGKGGNADEAIDLCNKVIERFGDDPTPALREQAAIAWVNKAENLDRKGETEKALRIFDDVIKLYGTEETAQDAVKEAKRLRDEILARKKTCDDAPKDKE